MQLMTELQGIEINKNLKLCSFDIENMYTSIPRNGIINVVNTILENLKTEMNVLKEIIQILGIVTEQNYFHFDQEYYKQLMD
jgi:hypothetical protein